jgi:hypothetical protein
MCYLLICHTYASMRRHIYSSCVYHTQLVPAGNFNARSIYPQGSFSGAHLKSAKKYAAGAYSRKNVGHGEVVSHNAMPMEISEEH